MSPIHWAIRRCMHFWFVMHWKRRATASKNGINGIFCIWCGSYCKMVPRPASIRRVTVHWHVFSGMYATGKCATNYWICWSKKKVCTNEYIERFDRKLTINSTGDPNIVGRDGSVPIMVCLVPLINKDQLHHFTHSMKVCIASIKIIFQEREKQPFKTLSLCIAGMLFELYTDIIAAWCKSELFVSLKFDTIARIDIYR